MGMLHNMTNLFTKITARGDAVDEPYYQMVENNLVYAVGKQLQASSSQNGGGTDSDHVNIAVSGGCDIRIYSIETSVLLENILLCKTHSKLHPETEWCLSHILSSEDDDDVISRPFTVASADSPFGYMIKKKKPAHK